MELNRREYFKSAPISVTIYGLGNLLSFGLIQRKINHLELFEIELFMM